ncbi:MAG: DUF1292 domain-containing protein [Bacilli bacterium]|jgi:uncharacterized protein YrzB (UPF0473 family)|nr:DUF1292 domain-containing protein [Bacilli bacterium]
MNDELNKISIVNENGDTKEYEIMLTFTNEDTGYNYVFYYDENEADEDGTIQTFVSRYDENTNELFELEDDEMKMVEEVFNTFVEEEGLMENE